jgi:hypothetical protein
MARDEEGEWAAGGVRVQRPIWRVAGDEEDVCVVGNKSRRLLNSVLVQPMTRYRAAVADETRETARRKLQDLRELALRKTLLLRRSG